MKDHQKTFQTQSLEQDHEKQKGLGTSDQSLFQLQNKVRKILLLGVYLSKFDDVILHNF